MKQVPIGVSARHIHLCEEDLELIMGKGNPLTVLKYLSQPGQFASAEMVAVVGPRGSLQRVRIIGPCRNKSQVEISLTDAISLGVNAPIRESGMLDGTPGIRIVGSAGEIELKQGLIVTMRHIHFHTQEAERWNIVNKQLLKVKMHGLRPLIFEDVIARVSDHFKLELHIDTDEANAAGASTGDFAEVVN